MLASPDDIRLVLKDWLSGRADVRFVVAGPNFRMGFLGKVTDVTGFRVTMRDERDAEATLDLADTVCAFGDRREASGLTRVESAISVFVPNGTCLFLAKIGSTIEP